MKIPKLLLETWTRTGKAAPALALAWIIVFAPVVAEAQGKSQPQKESAAAQFQPTSEVKTSAKAEIGAAKSDRSGEPQEGIKVHGHWVIEILNSDGTLASRSEFENALVPGSSEVALARLLGQPSKVTSWAIATNDGTANNGPCETGSGPTPCVATPTLPLNPATNLPDGTLVLKITATAKRSLTIRSVFTQLVITDASGGAFLIAEPFTSKTLDLADQKTVVQDQVIQITVKFSFS
jgi:hypothetical protein